MTAVEEEFKPLWRNNNDAYFSRKKSPTTTTETNQTIFVRGNRSSKAVICLNNDLRKSSSVGFNAPNTTARDTKLPSVEAQTKKTQPE